LVTVAFWQQLTVTVVDKLLIGVLLALVGFWLNKKLKDIETRYNIRKEVVVAGHKAAMDQLAAQIRELYSPLYGMLQQSEQVIRIVRAKLPYYAANGHPSEGEWPTWRYFVETHFRPGNTRMAELIRSKIYLVQEDQLPDSWIRFLEHQTNFEVLDRLWMDKCERTTLPGPGWPSGFNEDVGKTLSELRAAYNRHAQMITSETTVSASGSDIIPETIPWGRTRSFAARLLRSLGRP
jgi:hypothetical protein